jgi:hypothetical protein
MLSNAIPKNNTQPTQPTDKQKKFSHPYPGNSLIRSKLPTELRGPLYELGVIAMGKGYLIDPSNKQLCTMWNTYERDVQRILAKLESYGFIERYLEHFHDEGKIKTKRQIKLIPLDMWQKSRQIQEPAIPHKTTDTTNMSGNIIKEVDLRDNDNTLLPKGENVENKSVETFDLYNLSKKEPKTLKEPSPEIKERMKNMLRDAIKPFKWSTNYHLWVVILYSLGFDREGIKFFGSRLYFQLKNAPEVFYSILELLSKSINSVNSPAAWTMAEMKAYCGVITQRDRLRAMSLAPPIEIIPEPQTRREYTEEEKQAQQDLLERLEAQTKEMDIKKTEPVDPNKIMENLNQKIREEQEKNKQNWDKSRPNLEKITNMLKKREKL